MEYIKKKQEKDNMGNIWLITESSRQHSTQGSDKIQSGKYPVIHIKLCLQQAS